VRRQTSSSNISLAVVVSHSSSRKGLLTALMGPSGAGKTTWINCVVDQLISNKAGCNDTKLRIGYVTQEAVDCFASRYLYPSPLLPFSFSLSALIPTVFVTLLAVLRRRFWNFTEILVSGKLLMRTFKESFEELTFTQFRTTL
jgi:ATPase subunit of ABC transporter with duplicated ATPase domains